MIVTATTCMMIVTLIISWLLCSILSGLEVMHNFNAIHHPGGDTRSVTCARATFHWVGGIHDNHCCAVRRLVHSYVSVGPNNHLYVIVNDVKTASVTLSLFCVIWRAMRWLLLIARLEHHLLGQWFDFDYSPMHLTSRCWLSEHDIHSFIILKLATRCHHGGWIDNCLLCHVPPAALYVHVQVICSSDDGADTHRIWLCVARWWCSRLTSAC